MVIYMIETRIINAIFISHYPLRAELGKILVLEYDFGGTRTRTRTRETAHLPSSDLNQEFIISSFIYKKPKECLSE
jgi:hypothetical protein